MHFRIDNAKKIVEDDQKHEQETAESPAISLDYYMKCLTGVRTYIQANGTDMATLNVLQRLENDCVVKKHPTNRPKLLTILHVNSTSSTACVAITHQIHFVCKTHAVKAKI